MLTLKAGFTRALIGVALAGSLAACVVQPTRQADVVHETPARPDPHMEAVHRMDQVNGRINSLWRHVDQRVSQGFYPPPQGEAYHHRLDVVRQEARDMASQHGGGLSGEEQHTLNGELDGLQHTIQ
jgi:hypothetical protein